MKARFTLWLAVGVVSALCGFAGAFLGSVVFAGTLQGERGPAGPHGDPGATGPPGPPGPEPQLPIGVHAMSYSDALSQLDRRVRDLESAMQEPRAGSVFDCFPTPVVTDVQWWGSVNPNFPLQVTKRTYCLRQ
jgi:hypothetical protein